MNHVFKAMLKSLKNDLDNILLQVNKKYNEFFNNRELEEFAILEEVFNQLLDEHEKKSNLNLLPYAQQDIQQIQRNLKLMSQKAAMFNDDMSLETKNIVLALKKLNLRLKQIKEKEDKFKIKSQSEDKIPFRDRIRVIKNKSEEERQSINHHID